MKAMKVIVPLTALFFLTAVTAAFLGGRELAFAAGFQLLPAMLSNAWIILAAILAVTLLFGRFFCRAMCPLGILQSVVNRIFHPKSAVRRVCTRMPESAAQRIVRWTVLVAAATCIVGGLGAWAGMLDPYAIYGRALSLLPALDGEGGAAPTAFAAVSAAMFVAILIIAAAGSGRVWCNWICPAGTVFNLLARFAWQKDKVAGGCGNCRRCFPKPTSEQTCAEGEAGKSGEAKGDGVTRRDAIRTMAAVAAGEKLTDGGLAEVSLPGRPERERSALPPGAGKREDFFRKCISCQLCVKNCPTHCLVPSVALAHFGQPEMDFRFGSCHPECTRCSEVCPTGAIARLTKAEKRTAHIGHAVWRADACLRAKEGVECTACVRKCPVKAVHIVKNLPVVDEVACIGCGACEHSCPARPMPGIAVNGVEAQWWTSPAPSATALAGPPTALDASLAAVAANGGAW